MLFFPVENLHLVQPKQNFRRFKKWKAKKKKQKQKQKQTNKQTNKQTKTKTKTHTHTHKEKVLSSFWNFPSFYFQFSFFSSLLWIFFPSHFFPVGQQKFRNFPVRSLWGHSAPSPPPVTPLLTHRHIFLNCLFKLRLSYVKFLMFSAECVNK